MCKTATSTSTKVKAFDELKKVSAKKKGYAAAAPELDAAVDERAYAQLRAAAKNKVLQGQGPEEATILVVTDNDKESSLSGAGKNAQTESAKRTTVDPGFLKKYAAYVEVHAEEEDMTQNQDKNQGKSQGKNQNELTTPTSTPAHPLSAYYAAKGTREGRSARASSNVNDMTHPDNWCHNLQSSSDCQKRWQSGCR